MTNAAVMLKQIELWKKHLNYDRTKLFRYSILYYMSSGRAHLFKYVQKDFCARGRGEYQIILICGRVFLGNYFGIFSIITILIYHKLYYHHRHHHVAGYNVTVVNGAERMSSMAFFIFRRHLLLAPFRKSSTPRAWNYIIPPLSGFQDKPCASLWVYVLIHYTINYNIVSS